MLGMHRFTIGGVSEERALLPFSLWMAQRPLDHTAQLTAGDKNAVDELLTQVGGEQAFRLPQFPRLARENNKLVLD